MTTPTTPANPARMTEAELHELETTSPLSLYAALQRIEVLLQEIRDSREEEARLERKRAAEERFGEALAHEVGEQIAARLELERANSSLARERDELREDIVTIANERYAAQEKARLLREYVEDAAKLECLCTLKGGCGCSVAVRDSAKETLEEVDHAK